MPLLDHFRPPLQGRRHWEGFHGGWAAAIVGELNESLLPPQYFAEFQVTLSTRIEVVVGTLTEDWPTTTQPSDGPVAILEPRTWAPPSPTAVVPIVFPDDIEVRVFSTEAGPTLVAAIKFVSPANKDRDETRRAFVSKCAAYLQRGIGLMVLDIVMTRHANLHAELMTFLGPSAGVVFPKPTLLYATAYRPAHREGRNEMDVWREALALGQPLPTLPLAIRGLGALPIDLEATYMVARKRGRIDASGTSE
jgi:hypothetical protein